MIKLKNMVCLLGAAAIAMGFVACDDSVLTSSAAKKALKKEVIMRDSVLVHSLDLGFYEVKSGAIEKLGQMEAAGLITLDVKRVIEHRRRSHYNYWYGYTYYNEDIEHYFANVALTEQGRKYVVTKVPRYSKEMERDFPQLVNDEPEEMPEWMNFDVDAYLAKFNPDANPTEAAPAAEEVVDVEEVAVEEVADSAVVEAVEVAEEPVEVADEPADEPTDEYEALLAKVETNEVNVLVGKIKIAKVTNIFCPKEMAENGTATCEYIMEYYDKTPFGYVFGSPRNGKRTSWSASLKRYEDLGWRIENVTEK